LWPLLWGLLLAALAGVAAAALWQRLHGASGEAGGEAAARAGAAAALPVLGHVPEFRLVGYDGRGVGLADLAGAPWIADFVFTHCVASCPMLSARMARLDRTLPAAVRLVSFSVDPARDTPAVLASYARSFTASPRWLFLTGAAGEVRRLSRQGFKLAVEPGVGAAPEAILHSNRFVLVDAAGAIRAYYDALDPRALRRLEEDARALASAVTTAPGRASSTPPRRSPTRTSRSAASSGRSACGDGSGAGRRAPR
jgi:cytochrome oxidase Cu insertion factor (SCO1/SenC/PrrC family)